MLPPVDIPQRPHHRIITTSPARDTTNRPALLHRVCGDRLDAQPVAVTDDVYLARYQNELVA